MPPQPSQTRAIFISYRRDDAGGEAGRLYDDLTRAFSEETVFMDVAGILPGRDFRKTIDENVAQCGVLLAVIGRQWLTILDSSGARRLDSPNDFVRLEIASALTRNIPVIPVLVQNASMPLAEALPEPLQDLAYRNAVELTLPRWNSDVALLTAALKSYAPLSPATAPEPVNATIPVRVPPPSPPPPRRAKPSLNLIFGPIAAAIVLAALILIGLTVALYEYGKKLPPTPAPITQSQPAQTTPAQPAQTSPAQQAPSPHPPASSKLPPSASTQPQNQSAAVPNRVIPALSPAAIRPGNQPTEAPPIQKPLPDTRRWGEQQYHIELPYNLVGIYNEDRHIYPAGLGLDGSGRAYHSFLDIMTPGTHNLPLDGATFHIPPNNIKNVFRCQPIPTIELSTGVYTTMRVLAVGTHGPQLSVPFTVTFEGSKKQDFFQNISDWTAADAPRFPGEHLAFAQTYATTATGPPQNGRFAVYEYNFALDDLYVQTLTLPHNDDVVILAITFVP